MTETASGAHPAPGQWRRLGVGRLLVLVAFALFLLLLVETASRLYWTLGRGVPFFDMSAIVYSFYPELVFAEGQPIRRDDRPVNVLLLGGSVVNDHYGNIGLVLEERLTRILRRPVLVHNLSRRSLTSLDSLYKYQHLEGQEFDLVIFYHGINETRANNCPPEVYRDDYSHFLWYESVNGFYAHPEVAWLVFPFTFEYAWTNASDRWGLSTHISRGRPREDWYQYGGDVKSAASFLRNLSALLALAGKRGDPVLLMSFAYYIAPGYSEDAFRRLALDYSRHGFPIELWGRPEHVAAALDAQNAGVERLAASLPYTLFVDQNRLIPKTGDNFNDVCHLTGKGCEAFVENILETVIRAVR